MGSQTTPSEKVSFSRPSTENDTTGDTTDETADEKKIIGDQQPQAKDSEPIDAEPEHGYLNGIQLAIVTASVTLVCFLVLLDTSIIATVSTKLRGTNSCDGSHSHCLLPRI
jgi:hypothetical protein